MKAYKPTQPIKCKGNCGFDDCGHEHFVSDQQINKEIKIGDFVQWEHKIPEWVDEPIGVFIAKGKVLSIHKCNTGGKRNNKTVAKILVHPHIYWRKISRKKTTISLYKLKKI